MSVRAHYEAFAAALRAGLPEACTVYEWDVPASPSFPYVLVWGDLGRESGESLAGTIDLLSLRPRCTYVGVTGAAVLAAADLVRDVLRHRVLIVHGWAPSRLEQAALATAQPDHQVTIPGTSSHPAYAVDEFPFTSQRA